MDRVKIREGLLLDSVGRCLIKNEEHKIFLTQMEFLLLHYFIENKNVVIYVGNIVDDINETYGKMYTEQNIYVYIRKIRIKLKKNHKKPNILRNIRPGYILDVPFDN